jgi:rod shape-determining protein MreC
VPLLLLIFCVTLLVLHETEIFSPVEGGLQFIFVPLQRAATALVEGVGGLFKSVRDVRELETQVAGLQAQVDALLSDNIRLQTYEAEAITLRTLLDFRNDNPTWAFLGADVVGQDACASAPCGEVIGQEPNPYLRYVSVNVGAADGVEVGMPVITGGSTLIGRTAEVGLQTTKVQLLNDTASSVAVRLQASRATGIVVGQPDGSLRMIYIPQSEEVEVGDIVLTSGLGGGLPRGLVVGQVAEVVRQDFALHQEAVVRPAIDYGQAELVLVITSFEPLLPEEVVEPSE